jgi:hypothetical protein
LANPVWKNLKNHVLTIGYVACVLTFIYKNSYVVEPDYQSSKLIYKIQKTEHANYTDNLNKEGAPFPTTHPDFPKYSNKLLCQDITKEVLQALPQSNESGLIGAFGVLLTYLPRSITAWPPTVLRKNLIKLAELKDLPSLS